MRKITVEGCEAFVIKDNLIVLIDIEGECVVFSRLAELDGKTYDDIKDAGFFEIPIKMKTLQRIYAAENELDLMIAALQI